MDPMGIYIYTHWHLRFLPARTLSDERILEKQYTSTECHGNMDHSTLDRWICVKGDLWSIVYSRHMYKYDLSSCIRHQLDKQISMLPTSDEATLIFPEKHHSGEKKYPTETQHQWIHWRTSRYFQIIPPISSKKMRQCIFYLKFVETSFRMFQKVMQISYFPPKHNIRIGSWWMRMHLARPKPQTRCEKIAGFRFRWRSKSLVGTGLSCISMLQSPGFCPFPENSPLISCVFLNIPKQQSHSKPCILQPKSRANPKHLKA